MLQVAQHADDLDRARDFYTRLLGAEPAGFFDPPGLLFFRVGPVRLLLEQSAPSALIYLKVDDLDAAVAALRAEGVEIASEPHVIFRHESDALGPAGTDEWMAFIRDSEGNTVGLVSHRPPE
jgi:methylmalonyl-CoA/ethylmalonyl-CoA epimerase